MPLGAGDARPFAGRPGCPDRCHFRAHLRPPRTAPRPLAVRPTPPACDPPPANPDPHNSTAPGPRAHPPPFRPTQIRHPERSEGSPLFRPSFPALDPPESTIALHRARATPLYPQSSSPRPPTSHKSPPQPRAGMTISLHYRNILAEVTGSGATGPSGSPWRGFAPRRQSPRLATPSSSSRPAEQKPPRDPTDGIPHSASCRSSTPSGSTG